MEKLNIYTKKLSKKKELELRQDVIIPDTKQDIVRILDENFFCYFSKVEILEGKIRVDGNVDAYISYISSSEETLGLQNSLFFEDVIEDKTIKDNMNLQYHMEVSKQDIKIINERKISIIITVQILYEVYGTNEIEVFNEFHSMEDMQIDSQTYKLHSLMGVNSTLASLKEEIKIESTNLVAEVLRINTSIINKEIKISYNKVLTKADLHVDIIYLTKDGRVGKTEERFPIMSFIEMENVKEENVCVTDYQIRNMVLNVNNGEDNSITLQMEYEIICQAYEIKEQEIVRDLYSLKYDIEITNKEIEIVEEQSSIVEKNIDINEKINLEDAMNVIDIFGKSRMVKSGEGEIELKIYFESNRQIGLNVKTITFPVVDKMINEDTDLILESMEFDFNDPNLTIRGRIRLMETNPQKQVINIVQSVTQKEMIMDSEYGMVVYSVKKNDTLWNIAKKFRIRQKNIIDSNELEEPYNFTYGEKIYIVR